VLGGAEPDATVGREMNGRSGSVVKRARQNALDIIRDSHYLRDVLLGEMPIPTGPLNYPFK
jgi:hypothetical protein